MLSSSDFNSCSYKARSPRLEVNLYMTNPPINRATTTAVTIRAVTEPDPRVDAAGAGILIGVGVALVVVVSAIMILPEKLAVIGSGPMVDKDSVVLLMSTKSPGSTIELCSWFKFESMAAGVSFTELVLSV